MKSNSENSIKLRRKYTFFPLLIENVFCGKAARINANNINIDRHQGIGEIFDSRKNKFVDDFKPKERKWHIEKFGSYYYNKNSFYYRAGEDDAASYMKKKKYIESKTINGKVIDAYVEFVKEYPEEKVITIYVDFRIENKYLESVGVSESWNFVKYRGHQAAGEIMEKAWKVFEKKENEKPKQRTLNKNDLLFQKQEYTNYHIDKKNNLYDSMMKNLYAKRC